MPAGDGTGPMGRGPMTGRGAGFCAGYGVARYMNSIPGRGLGMGFGGGRGGARGGGHGWRNMFYATGLSGWQRAAAGWPIAAEAPPSAGAANREQQMQALKSQAEFHESAPGKLRKRIEELESQKAGT